jgi:hypothetical protein
VQVDRTQALTALREQEQALQEDILDADGPLLAARALLLLARSNPELSELRMKQGTHQVRLRR